MISYNKFNELFKAIKSVYPVATLTYTIGKTAEIQVGNYSVDVSGYDNYDFLSATTEVFKEFRRKGLTDELAQQYYDETVECMKQAELDRKNPLSPAYSINGSAN